MHFVPIGHFVVALVGVTNARGPKLKPTAYMSKQINIVL